MRRIIVMLSLVMLSSFAMAQKASKKTIPAVVKSAFQKAYPDVTKVKWDKEGANYEAGFEVAELEQSVLLDAQGNILETEVEIALGDLPQAALDYVKAHYIGKSIKECAKIVNSKGIVTYEAEVKGLDVLFDEKGVFIKEARD